MCPKVRFVFSEVEMKVTGFKMKELLNLRKEYMDTHVFFFWGAADPELSNFCLPFHSCLVEGIAIHSYSVLQITVLVWSTLLTLFSLCSAEQMV